MSIKIPLTPAGIEPATLRFVAQHLNCCTTAVHRLNTSEREIFRRIQRRNMGWGEGGADYLSNFFLPKNRGGGLREMNVKR